MPQDNASKKVSDYIRGGLARLVHLRLAVIAHDLIMVWAGWLASRALSVSGSQGLETPLKALLLPEIPLIIVIQGAVFWYTGLYRGLWRFASLPDLWNLIKGAVLGTGLVMLALWLTGSYLLRMQPQLVIFYPIALVIFLGGPRLLFRAWKDATRVERRSINKRRTLILGAGNAGAVLLRELQRHGDYQVVGFLDDNPALSSARVHGIKVHGTLEELPRLSNEMGVQIAIIAMPAATDNQMQRAVRLCEKADVEFKTLPGVHQLIAPPKQFQQNIEQVSRLDNLKTVALEDLLGRAPIDLDWESMHAGFHNKNVLITGGGGSIGSELAELIAQLTPANLIIIDNSEYNLYRIELELHEKYPDLKCRFILGDILDAPLLNQAFERYQPEVVMHAAAYKHLPMLQNQVRAAVRNNVIATREVVQAALSCKAVQSFVLISTDKAVNPSNTLGASKRVAELYCHAVQESTSRIRFITVRFGNVLNSTGSVVPRFREQIKRGGPVTVTDPEITRYFMTLREAAALILQAAMLGSGGEIFVLDMGQPIKIRFLAEQMIRLHGKTPGDDMEIIFTGLRAGEKLNEELFYASEALKATAHSKVMQANGDFIALTELEEKLRIISQAIDNNDIACISNQLNNLLSNAGDTITGTS